MSDEDQREAAQPDAPQPGHADDPHVEELVARGRLRPNPNPGKARALTRLLRPAPPRPPGWPTLTESHFQLQYGENWEKEYRDRISKDPTPREKVRAAMAQEMARDIPEHTWLEHVLDSARAANRRANRLARWMPSLSMLALLAFIALCTAMIVATRVYNTALLIGGLVVGIPITAAVLITIGYAIGQSQTVHRWVDSLDPAHARTSTTADNAGERR